NQPRPACGSELLLRDAALSSDQTSGMSWGGVPGVGVERPPFRFQGTVIRECFICLRGQEQVKAEIVRPLPNPRKIEKHSQVARDLAEPWPRPPLGFIGEIGPLHESGRRNVPA